MKVAAFRVKAPADDLLMPLLVSNCSPRIVIICSVTGGVYKARERIHRDMLIRDY